MVNSPEKPRPYEGQQEDVKTPDQNTPEVPEYNETGLKEMVDQSHKQIDTEQGRVFDNAEKRIETAPTSVGLDETKSAPIKQGFMGRIQNIKGRISELSAATKTRTQETLQPQSETVENKEREKVMEQFQEKRGNMLTNVLTSEVASQGMDLIPFAGSGKMIVESISGKTLSGKKLTGKDRIIHGAIGAGSLLLDFTGIGEAKDLTIIAGKSIGLIEKAGVKLAERGALKSAAVFEKTAAFMAKHPEEVAKVEQFAEKKLQGLIKQVKTYRRGERPMEQAIPTTAKEEVVTPTNSPELKNEPQDTTEEVTIEGDKKLEQPEKLAEASIEQEVSRFAEKITNPEAKVLLEQNSEKFQQDVNAFKAKLEQTVNGREQKVNEFKEQLRAKLNEIRKAKEEVRYLSDQLANDEKELAASGPELENYQAQIKQLDTSAVSRLTNRNKILQLRGMAGHIESTRKHLQERITKNNPRRAELSQRLQSGDLSVPGLSTDQREALAKLEQQIGPTMTDANPEYQKGIDNAVAETTQKHFYGERGEFTEENNELLWELSKLKNELSFGPNARENLGEARDIKHATEQAGEFASRELTQELSRYTEKTYEAMAQQEGKPVEQVKDEVYKKAKEDTYKKAKAGIYANMSGEYRASLQLIGIKEADIDTYLQIEGEASAKLGLGSEGGTTKKDFEYARYRAYFEARRTGQNVFTHVTSGERAAQIIEQHALKSSKITTPEDLRDKTDVLRAAGQTTNIEENIYFTSGGGGFNYGNKIIEGSPQKREPADFAFFAATGNDILASGRSVDVATPTMREKGESLQGQGIGHYESSDGTEMPLDNLQLVVPESELGRYAAIFEQNGYDGNFAKEHLVGIPNDVVQQALKEGGGYFNRDSKVLHEYVDNQLKKELKGRSKNKDKIFATVEGRQSKDYSDKQVLKWEQVN